MYPMFTQEILQGIQLFMIALCGIFLPIVGMQRENRITKNLIVEIDRGAGYRAGFGRWRPCLRGVAGRDEENRRMM